MNLQPCSVHIEINLVLLLPFPPTPQDCTKELEKIMSYEALKNATITVQHIKEPFSHLS